jgi:hypothetical protein
MPLGNIYALNNNPAGFRPHFQHLTLFTGAFAADYHDCIALAHMNIVIAHFINTSRPIAPPATGNAYCWLQQS